MSKINSFTVLNTTLTQALTITNINAIESYSIVHHRNELTPITTVSTTLTIEEFERKLRLIGIDAIIK